MKTILYATDCNDRNASALKYAYRFSSIMKADLHVLHVYDFPPIKFSTIQPEELLKKRMQKEQKDIVYKYCAKHLKNEFHQKPVTVHAIENVSIVESILNMTKIVLPDMVILGTKDSNSNRGYFSGNIADAVLDKIETPVLIVPNGLNYLNLSTIVYATDFEEEDIFSIKKLIGIANPFGALIEIIHVFETDQYSANEDMEAFKQKLLKVVSYPDTIFKTIASSKIKLGLLSVLKNEHANMIAMLERKNNNSFNFLSRKDLVKDMETSVSIPLLAFNKENTKFSKSKIANNEKVMAY